MDLHSESVDLSSQTSLKLVRCAREPGIRALAWSGNVLYASRGYQLMRARVEDISYGLIWQAVASFRPPLKRRLSVMNRLTSRLHRDGFHALAVLPSGGLVGAVPGAVVTMQTGETEFHQTHRIVRGTRPLHITAIPGGAVFWGEYFDNRLREEVHIYASTDRGETWSVAHTFGKGSIRHVHNILHDPWENCLWILTGDYGDECRILRAACDFSHIEIVLQGRQQTRAAAAIATEGGLYFSSDTPLERNYVYRLDRRRMLSQLGAISSSSIYGCRVGRNLYFSTMVEPSALNRDRMVRIYGADISQPEDWQPVLAWQKDRWPMKLFQYGNAFFPDGDNDTPFLVLTTIAVESDDLVTSLYLAGP